MKRMEIIKATSRNSFPLGGNIRLTAIIYSLPLFEYKLNFTPQYFHREKKVLFLLGISKIKVLSLFIRTYFDRMTRVGLGNECERAGLFSNDKCVCVAMYENYFIEICR